MNSQMVSEKLLGILKSKPKITVLTGAGVSAESGVPTFRDKGGLWDAYQPEQLATLEAFESDPGLVWSWYQWRRRLIAGVEPNPGHYALAQMEEKTADFSLITQNVDGLHSKAGSKKILSLHGDIMRSYCISCGKEYEEKLNLDDEEPIKCECGGLMRPGVVWFGEGLPEETLRNAFTASSECELFISAGTSSIVYPAAMMPETAKRSGAYLVEINPEKTPLTGHADEFIQAKSGEALPVISDCINGGSG